MKNLPWDKFSGCNILVTGGTGLIGSCLVHTLMSNPHKNYQVISKIAAQAADEFGVEYLDMDFKKKAGFQRSVQLAKEYELYRQDYCGCRFSK